MTKNLIAEGYDISTIGEVDNQFNELDYGEARIYVDHTLSENEIVNIENQILSQGVHLNMPIFQDNQILIVSFQKRIAPLIIIGIVVGSIVAGLLGWQVFKSVLAGVPIWVWFVGAIGAAILFFGSSTGKKAVSAGTTILMKRVNPRRKHA